MWKYNNFDELYHYGVPGMRWGHRRAKNNVKTSKTPNHKNKQKWSTKKKVIVGATVTAGIVAGVVGSKKIKDYVNRTNSKVADHFFSKKMNELGWKKSSLKEATKLRDSVNNQDFIQKTKNVIKYTVNKGYPYK